MNPMPGRAPRSPRVAETITMAHTILEDEGRTALTMRHLADRIGMRAPSLYKHFPNKVALEAALVDDAFAEMGTALRRAVDQPGRRSPVAALLDAYHGTAIESPNLYRLTTGPDIPRSLLTPGLEAWSGEPFFLVTGEPHLAQALWACAHGLTILEIEKRFMDDSDLTRTWRAAAGAFTNRGRQ